MGDSLYGIDASLAVPFGVEDDPLNKGPLSVDCCVDQILEGIYRFALLADKQGCIIWGHVHCDKAIRVVDVDARLEAHSIHDGGCEVSDLLQELLRSSYVLSLGGFPQ